MSLQMLDRWAEKLGERRMISEFWEWLTEHDSNAMSVDIEVALDNFHGIDRVQLERERRELLDGIAREIE